MSWQFSITRQSVPGMHFGNGTGPCSSHLGTNPLRFFKSAILAHIYAAQPGRHPPFDLRFGIRTTRPVYPALAFSARTRRHLFFSLLFAAIPDPRPYRSGWCAARSPIPCSCRTLIACVAVLVRADAPVVFVRQCHAHGHLLDRTRGLRRRSAQSMATSELLYLFRLLSLVCCGGWRVFRLSIGRHAAGGRFYRAVLLPGWIAPRMGSV